MAKGIYYLKMDLTSPFTSQFHQNEIREIRVMSEFIAVFWAPWWLKAYLSCKAPSLDFEAMRLMRVYKEVNPEVAEPCLVSMARHTWYLTEELMVMCLADEDLPGEVRSLVAKKLRDTPRQEGDFRLGKPQLPSINTEEFWEGNETSTLPTGLAKLVGSRSWSIFNLLDLAMEDMEWLSEDSSQWVLHEGYRRFVTFVKGLQVVNDPAERGVKIIQDFIKISTDETLRQQLILSVAEHRKKNSKVTMTKKSLGSL